jgi:hypothetical protein
VLHQAGGRCWRRTERNREVVRIPRKAHRP